MKSKLLSLVCCLGMAPSLLSAQSVSFTEGKFKIGDQPEWKNVKYDDSSWNTISIMKSAQVQGYDFPSSYAWYRFTFDLDRSMLKNSDMEKTLRFALGRIDDTEDVYLNGHLIGSMPKDTQQPWSINRVYDVSADAPYVNWDGKNVLAVRVWNLGDPGGFIAGGIQITAPNRVEGLDVKFDDKASAKSAVCTINMHNTFNVGQKGRLVIKVKNQDTGSVRTALDKTIAIKPKGSCAIPVAYAQNEVSEITAEFIDSKSGNKAMRTYVPKYILTPAAPLSPRYNGPAVYGVRSGSPVIFRLPFSGNRPMTFAVDNLPEGLTLDATQGVITGKISKEGNYNMTLRATNDKGTAEAQFSIRCGNRLALTPAMGWNSWNCWGLDVNQDRVMASAKALIDRGLADYGYSYINVDDSWEADHRDANGYLLANGKFPDMKGLGDWLHERGLKFGIYSSPGDLTCGRYIGSLGYERQDAETWNSWGVDYLKYDWCGYATTLDTLRDQSMAAYAKPYMLMEEHLRRQPRDIYYSLCQYGMADVWHWGPAVDANSWRTTGDIEDTWESMMDIADLQTDLYPYAAPGHWNDPDMLVVGRVGWGGKLRDSRLTADEQYTHISLWSLLASNMLIGCALDQIDDFTFSLLCNNEVNAVDQDVLGIQAKCKVKDGDVRIYYRPLADGQFAIGIFNLSPNSKTVDFGQYFSKLGIKSINKVRDLWRQKDFDPSNTTYRINPHGVKFIKADVNLADPDIVKYWKSTK